jgi:hypothetical protein
MICLYCEDPALRAKYHHFYRDLGVLIESVPSGEFIKRSYLAQTDALLIIGQYPPGLTSLLSYRVPLFCVGRKKKDDPYSFDSYDSPELLSLLKRYGEERGEINHRSLLHISTTGKAHYLGYRLELTKTEASILYHLVNNFGRDVEVDELLLVCLGDAHRKQSNIARHVSNINRKAREIGDRSIIISVKPKTYRLREYI